ncbi:MAG: hypothetical protein ONB27_13825 [candidate division KSB1 bacterium]|nr:hypothetical protein [candidate division KSB1 bacterium]
MSDQTTANSAERFQLLLMGAIDNELTPEQWAEFQHLVNQDRARADEWKRFEQLKEVTQAMKFKSPSPEVWDNYWTRIYNRLERGVAWIIFSIGAVILLTYGIFKGVEAIIADPQLEGIIKIGIIAVILGLVILIVSVIREKFFIHKSDPYKEIQR